MNSASVLVDKTVLNETSPVSPALASLDGRLYLAWKGDGNDNLNLISSADDGRTFGRTYTSPERSPASPSLCAHRDSLYVAWKGDGNDNLNIARALISGLSIGGLTDKVTLGDTSPVSPSIASLNGRLFIAWKGDGNDNLNLMSSQDGRTFQSQVHIARDDEPGPRPMSA